MFVLVFCVDLCKMEDITEVYSISTAIECMNAPLLTQEVFNQNQKSVENLLELYVFKETAANPPTEYVHLTVDINAGLTQIRSNYQAKFDAGIPIQARSYFNDLANLFLKLKDPHTLFIQPNFFFNFKMYFPFILENSNGQFYAKNYPTTSIFFSDLKARYEQIYGQLEINQNDRIIKINNQQPLQYLTQFSNKYDYTSKSEHGRLNSQLLSNFYVKRLDLFTLPDVQDQQFVFQFESGKQIQVNLVVKISKPLISSQAAIEMYNNEINNKKNPYLDKTNKLIPIINNRYQIFDQNPYNFASNAQDEDFEKVLESPNYFILYKYNKNITTQKFDYVLSIKSFNPTNILIGLQDTVKLLRTIDNLDSQHKLYISVLGNGGGMVSLSHLLAVGLFHTEYPIYGRYTMRKSKLVELLLKSGSDFADLHRIEWDTGKTLTNTTIINSTVSMKWYQSTIDTYFTQYFAFDNDQNGQVLSYTQQIYTHVSKLNPNNVVLLTDQLCISTCACFTKHLLQMKNVYAIGLGGAYESTDTFDVGSAAGGVVKDSNDYELAVKKLKNLNYPELNKEEIEVLTENWLPHNGFLRFAHYSINDFDSRIENAKQLEYKSMEVNQVIHIYPSFYDWSGLTGLKNIIPLAQQASENEKYIAFGEICGTCGHSVISRMIQGKCQQFGCKYGYYRANPTNNSKCDFECIKRVDQYLQNSNEEDNIGIIVGIVIGAIVVVFSLIISMIYFAKKYHKGKNQITDIEDKLVISLDA
ncbi:Conserved_hypothetical protein [Hexamita inflata]|uniref:Uncharacterized protein n=1 Tax=Hexamita inflata TaxID=28002 RepID=A0AA86UYP6_9EUKA|nr:Conserved hypothetical protein [Hexamita inflata]